MFYRPVVLQQTARGDTRLRRQEWMVWPSVDVLWGALEDPLRCDDRVREDRYADGRHRRRIACVRAGVGPPDGRPPPNSSQRRGARRTRWGGHRQVLNIRQQRVATTRRYRRRTSAPRA